MPKNYNEPAAQPAAQPANAKPPAAVQLTEATSSVLGAGAGALLAGIVDGSAVKTITGEDNPLTKTPAFAWFMSLELAKFAAILLVIAAKLATGRGSEITFKKEGLGLISSACAATGSAAVAYADKIAPLVLVGPFFFAIATLAGAESSRQSYPSHGTAMGKASAISGVATNLAVLTVAATVFGGAVQHTSSALPIQICAVGGAATTSGGALMGVVNAGKSLWDLHGFWGNRGYQALPAGPEAADGQGKSTGNIQAQDKSAQDKSAQDKSTQVVTSLQVVTVVKPEDAAPAAPSGSANP